MSCCLVTTFFAASAISQPFRDVSLTTPHLLAQRATSKIPKKEGHKIPKDRDTNCKTVPKEIAQKHGRETC